jgi:uncharacterized membrane protein
MWGDMMRRGGSNGGVGGMMGNGSSVGSGVNRPSYLWTIPVALIAVVVVAVIGLAFYLVFPEIGYNRNTCAPLKTAPSIIDPAKGTDAAKTNLTASSSTCEVLLKTMTPEEQKVLTVLTAHQGRHLQKYVGKEAGLNRLKTHRIIARFAQRGIVTVKQYGNTNEIFLSDWVQNSKAQNSTAP